MFFYFSFYLFSLLLSYTDYKSFIVPNVIIVTMLVMLLFFGIVEERISYLNFFWPVALLIFLGLLYIINPKLYMAGGDVKYLMVTGIYIDFILFPYFLLLCALLQFFVQVYVQKVKKRRYVAMIPVMFLSVIVVDLFANEIVKV